MQIAEQVPLAQHSTMRLGGPAAYLCEVANRSDLLAAFGWAHDKRVPMIMIGSGSNIVWNDAGFPGLVIVNKIMGYQVINEDADGAYITLGSGENWDSVVERSVASGLTGIEALSLIPGTAGATPVQNVGAYGQEIAQTLTTVEAFDTKIGNYVTLAGTDCGFGYRTSRFKTTDRGRFFITALTLHLRKANPEPPFYGQVQTYFEENNITEYTPTRLREAVVHIRSNKLPDPVTVNNTGSFFANPIIGGETLINLKAQHENFPNWPTDDGRVKVSAAWLIEQVGFKDYHDAETGMGTWPRQPLVLVNEHAKSTAQLLAFKQKIVSSVQQQFGITLEQEPELI